MLFLETAAKAKRLLDKWPGTLVSVVGQGEFCSSGNTTAMTSLSSLFILLPAPPPRPVSLLFLSFSSLFPPFL